MTIFLGEQPSERIAVVAGYLGTFADTGVELSPQAVIELRDVLGLVAEDAARIEREAERLDALVKLNTLRRTIRPVLTGAAPNLVLLDGGRAAGKRGGQS